MADKVTKVETYLRWEAIVEIVQSGKAVEDIFLGGVAAPDKPTASRLVAERAHMFVKNGNYRQGTSVKIRDLIEEGETPKFVASPAKAHPVNTQQQSQTRTRTQTRPHNTRHFSPFKCPIVNLCSTRMLGTISGTTVKLTDAPKETQS